MQYVYFINILPCQSTTSLKKVFDSKRVSTNCMEILYFYKNETPESVAALRHFSLVESQLFRSRRLRRIWLLHSILVQKVCYKTTTTAQRLALAAVGGWGDSPSKRNRLRATKTLKKRAAYPPHGPGVLCRGSAARCVGRTLRIINLL